MSLPPKIKQLSVISLCLFLFPIGKTATATDIAHYYDIAFLNVDDVVTDAISKGTTPTSLKARELCAEAAQRRREEQRAAEESEEKKASLENHPISK